MRLSRIAVRYGVAAVSVAALLAGSALQADAHPVARRPPAGAILIPANNRVTTTVLSKDAGDTLGYGLQDPVQIEVCSNCVAGDTKRLGSYQDGQLLVFYLDDETHQETFLSTDPAHAQVVRTTKYTWVINWDDAGGDGDFNDLRTSVKLTPK